MQLYEINDRIEEVLESGFSVDEETGEYWDSESLDELSASFDEKAEAVALYIKNAAAEVDAIKAEEKALAERRRSKERRVEWLKGYLVSNFERMGKKGIETPRCKVTTRTTKRVEVVDETRVPVDFIRVKEERTVDKKAIMAAFKCGTYVPGAELVSSTSATVK